MRITKNGVAAVALGTCVWVTAMGQPHARAEECGAGKVKAEDGTCVPGTFYDHLGEGIEKKPDGSLGYKPGYGFDPVTQTRYRPDGSIIGAPKTPSLADATPTVRHDEAVGRKVTGLQGQSCEVTSKDGDVDCEKASWDADTASDRPAHAEEDDAWWDCRFDGNRICAVQIEGVEYYVTFGQAGQPSGVSR